MSCNLKLLSKVHETDNFPQLLEWVLLHYCKKTQIKSTFCMILIYGTMHSKYRVYRPYLVQKGLLISQVKLSMKVSYYFL